MRGQLGQRIESRLDAGSSGTTFPPSSSATRTSCVGFVGMIWTATNDRPSGVETGQSSEPSTSARRLASALPSSGRVQASRRCCRGSSWT